MKLVLNYVLIFVGLALIIFGSLVSANLIGTGLSFLGFTLAFLGGLLAGWNIGYIFNRHPQK